MGASYLLTENTAIPDLVVRQAHHEVLKACDEVFKSPAFPVALVVRLSNHGGVVPIEELLHDL
jgi:hypothetical protein